MEFEGSVDAYRKGQGDKVFTAFCLYGQTHNRFVHEKRNMRKK